VSRTVTAGDIVATFEVDDYTRWRLLEGLDDISLTLRHEQDITDFEAGRPAHKPTTVTA
jgi:3-isopropylmalate/(R)-2-methylmalate dehydratase small subunit